MHRLFWTFCTFLIILTLLSAFGGGIRYRENFFEELFDTIGEISDSNDVDEISDDILKQTMVSEEVSGNITNNPSSVVMNVPEEAEEVVVNNKTVSPVVSGVTQNDDPLNYGPALIEAFDGEMYASF